MTQSSKPLIINTDENYYETRPADHGYVTPSQLSRKLGKIPRMCFYMHMNCSNILPKMSDIRELLRQVPIGILAVTDLAGGESG